MVFGIVTLWNWNILIEILLQLVAFLLLTNIHGLGSRFCNIQREKFAQLIINIFLNTLYILNPSEEIKRQGLYDPRNNELKGFTDLPSILIKANP